MQNVLTAIMPLPFALSRAKNRINFNIFRFLIASAALSFIALCVVQANSYTRDIYLIQEYKNRIAQISEENKAMELNSLNLNSLASVGAYAESQSFEKAERIEYIKLLGSTAVAR